MTKKKSKFFGIEKTEKKDKVKIVVRFFKIPIFFLYVKKPKVKE